jgi:hypothetical protein
VLDAQSFAECLRRCAAAEAVALMAPVEVVVGQEAVEVALNLDDFEVPCRALRIPADSITDSGGSRSPVPRKAITRSEAT